MPLDHMSECKELSCLPLLLDVWSNPAEVLAWKPKTLTAVGTIASKVSQLYNYITSVEKAILHAVGTPNRIISELLMAEQVVCSTKFTELLKGLRGSQVRRRRPNVAASTQEALANVAKESPLRHARGGSHPR